MKLVLFDVDGTLLDSQHLIYSALSQTLARMERPLMDRAFMLSIVGLSLETAMAQPADPLHRSRNAGQAYVAFALAEPHAYRLMFDLNQPTEDEYPELQSAIVRARRTMTVHIEAMIAAGLLEGDAELIGHMFWSALHGMLMLQLS